jgi:carbon storage regulator
MLVLARKVGQQIRIGEAVVLRVLRLKGRCARIGIEAPRGVLVRREEARRRPAGPGPAPGEGAEPGDVGPA